MVAYFKLQGSHTKIKCLNVEIRRLSTWMRDEEWYLHVQIMRLEQEDPLLAHQLSKQRDAVVAVNQVHRRRIGDLEALEGFTGWRGTGIRKGTMAVDGGTRVAPPLTTVTLRGEDKSDVSDDEGAAEAVDATYEAIGSCTD